MANSPLFQAGECVKMLSFELFDEDEDGNSAKVEARYEFFIVLSAYLVTYEDTYEYASRTPYFTYTLQNIDTGSFHKQIPEHKLLELTPSEETYIRLLYAKK